MSTLSAHQRDDLKDSDFALSGRRYPIADEAHARNALARVAQHGTPNEIAEVRRKVKAKFPNIEVAASQFILAASQLGDFTDASAPAGLPGEIDGQPVAYRRKHMAYCGTFYDEKTGKPFTLDRARFDKWVSNHARYVAAGNSVPLPTVDHFADDAKLKGTSLGNLLSLERVGDDLYGVHQFIGQDAIAAAARNGSSVFVEAGKIDGAGNVYDEVLTHNLITPKPLIPGLAPFKAIAIAASAGGISIITSDKPSQQRSIAMPLLEDLRTAFQLPADADEAAISAKFKEHMTAVAASTKSLNDTKTALSASQSALAAAQPKVPDEYTLGLIRESLDTKRQAAVAACTPAIVDEFDGIFYDAEKKPTPLALSQVAGRTLVGRLYDVLAKIKVVPTGQQSGVTLAASLPMYSDKPGAGVAAAAAAASAKDPQLALLEKQVAAYAPAK